MSANILLIEYEPRYVERVQEALKASGYRLEIGGDIDAAVECCAGFEPHVVIITSVLPNTKIEDAITQLRARAGLRSTPFLILMSGYRGADSEADAERYGAQDILERPFSADQLTGRINNLLEEAPDPAATQAIPQEMLQALRQGPDDVSGGPSLTSDDLFGDILSDVEEDSKQVKPPTQDAAVEKAKKHEESEAAASPEKTGEVQNVLADVIREGRSAPPIERKAAPTETDVDMILSQTLAGLDIQPVRSKPAKPEASPAATPPKSEAKQEEVKPAPPAEKEAPKAAPPKAKESAKKPAKKSVEKAAPPVSPAKEPPKAKVEGAAKDGSQFGQYVLVEHIATGGMAEVHKARMIGMEGFQKIVAIKRILPHLTDNEEFVTMFIDEAKLAAQLNHNNIIHIYDLGKIDRSYYIAMEYIEGQDLRALLKECRDRDVRLPVPLAIHITTLLASALEYAHRKRDFENRDLGLVHRDVSPQNVLISDDGDIKLCDFGIAKAASKASHTRAGALKGKLQYMSPEQAWGKSIDHRSDIFSLGSVLYEMLTGQKLFAGDSELSILEQVRNPKVKAPSEANPEVSKYVNRIVMRALEANPDKRYQSARELRRDLEKLARRHGWSVDSIVLARFMGELAKNEPITPLGEAKGKGKADAKAAAAKPEAAASSKAKDKAKATKPEPAKKAAAAAPATPKKKDEPKKPVEKPTPEPVAVADEGDEDGEKAGSMKWLLIGAAAIVVIGLGLMMMLGGDDEGGETAGAAAQVAPTAVPTAVPDDISLLTEEEMIEQAAQVAAEIVDEKTEEMQARLEEEFPTPTPVPPTPTPEPTPEPVAAAEPTPTPVPPTPTPTPIPPTPTPKPPTPTPTPSVREGDIVAASDAAVIAPMAISRATPKFPKMAERVRADGTVTLEILVGTNGAVEQVRNVTCTRTGVGFESAAEEAVRQWRYKPATKNGVKVKMWIPVRLPFTIK